MRQIWNQLELLADKFKQASLYAKYSWRKSSVIISAICHDFSIVTQAKQHNREA